MTTKNTNTALADITETALAVTTPQAAFDYNSVPDDLATTLRKQAANIRGLVKRTTAAIIEVGGDLIAVKRTLKHGQFQAWVEAECGFSLRAAENYIRAAEFAYGKNATVANLNPGIVYLLASKSAPPEIVEQVIAEAAAGNVMPDRVVKGLIREKRVEVRQQESRARRAERKARRPEKVREREERERLEYQAKREREKAENLAKAQSIIERFSPEDVRFLADTLTGGILDEFRRLVAEGSIAS